MTNFHRDKANKKKKIWKKNIFFALSLIPGSKRQIKRQVKMFLGLIYFQNIDFLSCYNFILQKVHWQIDRYIPLGILKLNFPKEVTLLCMIFILVDRPTDSRSAKIEWRWCHLKLLTKKNLALKANFHLNFPISLSSYILRRPQNFAKYPPIIWLAVERTNNW